MSDAPQTANTVHVQQSTTCSHQSEGEAGRRVYQQFWLIALTLLALFPFINKAIHIDDPIFIWTAQHITHHPLDPYGFSALWWSQTTPMWQIQQNPPLASYFMATIGSIGGWSEKVLHLGFTLPALILILGTYHLALRLTNNALIAAAATLFTPGFLVSATGLMCDISMVAVWMVAVLLWVKGLDGAKPSYLVISGLLIGACALTKYFGMSLVPLLFAFSLLRERKLRVWLPYLLLPVAILVAYELYTNHLYGYGLIGQAVQHKSYVRGMETHAGRALVGLSFTGGCALTALTFAPLLWSRKQILWGALLSTLLGAGFYFGWISTGSIYAHQEWLHTHKLLIAAQLTLYIACSISVVGLAITDWIRHRDSASLLLLLWVAGTMLFAIVVNWDVNARSILPMIPAIGILIARRLDYVKVNGRHLTFALVAIPIIVSGAIALWAAAGDMALANTSRLAAAYVKQKSAQDSTTVRFEGRWGFEYYMLQMGARPLEPGDSDYSFGDLIVLPKYNTSTYPFPLKTTAQEAVDFPVHSWIATMNPDAGGGFYFSGWGPLPFAVGPVPAQPYLL